MDLLPSASSGTSRSSGLDATCAGWFAWESPTVGVGVETVDIDAAAWNFDPPVHYFVLSAGKCAVTRLADLAALPPTGRS